MEIHVTELTQCGNVHGTCFILDGSRTVASEGFGGEIEVNCVDVEI